ncbi:MAG: toxin-antitoxin system, toxin component, HicA family protein [Deltaproteobacteria bacterium CG11_big_fil_rev_8_21_14_0_20_47_16]|nr:MAG: toxin-antitoxin system, toxin component, HicA family protein [Deltaproteobacteria bacterium CG11_big_fil_rev_8_21_14_0_20_47_16]
MKKKNIIKKLVQNGWWLLRQGSRHEVWTNGDIQTAVPRHKEINEFTGGGIVKIAEQNPARKK